MIDQAHGAAVTPRLPTIGDRRSMAGGDPGPRLFHVEALHGDALDGPGDEPGRFTPRRDPGCR